MTLGSKFRRRGRFARQNREQVAIGPVKGTSGGHRTVEAVSAQFSRGGGETTLSQVTMVRLFTCHGVRRIAE